MLNIHVDEFDAHFLKVGGRVRVVGVIMGREQVFNVGELDANAFEFVLEFGECSGKAYVDEADAVCICEDVVVGR